MVDDKEKIRRRINLKGTLVETLIRVPKVKLVYHPSHIKFDETIPLFLADLNEINNFSIGDQIVLNTTRCDWLTGGEWTVPFDGDSYFNARHMSCSICGFFKLTGHIINSRIKISDIFCALACFPLHETFKVLREESVKNGPILLFWLEGLKLATTPP